MVAKSYSFQESVDYLLSLGNEVSAMKLGLENIRKLLAALGDPQNNYLKVQVAGTNGKGSVCAFLDSICREAAIKTGLYTSPHLISITERVKIDGEDVSETDFARLASIVRNAAEELIRKDELEYTPTFFEQVTAIALLAFAEAKVDLAILETGLGGRLDATTAADAEIAAITRIDYDHQQYLGESIEEIAAEKAAIIRNDFQEVVIGSQSEEALKILLDRCKETIVGKEILSPDDPHMWRLCPTSDSPELVLNTTLAIYDDVSLGLAGRHQIENAQTALMIAFVLLYRWGFDITDDHLLDGLENARHPGRLEWLNHEGNRILLDGAHNPGGAKALSDHLSLAYSDSKITLVFGMMEDKNVEAVAELLFPQMENIILTRPNNPRAVDPEELAVIAQEIVGPSKVFVVPDVADAIDSALQITSGYPAPQFSFTCVSGSLYLVGEVKNILSRGIAL